MRWQQRVRVATGLSCWQIVLHLLVVALLVMGWMSGTLVRVGFGIMRRLRRNGFINAGLATSP